MQKNDKWALIFIVVRIFLLFLQLLYTPNYKIAKLKTTITYLQTFKNKKSKKNKH